MRWSLRCSECAGVDTVEAESAREAHDSAKKRGWTAEATPWGTIVLCPEHDKEEGN